MGRDVLAPATVFWIGYFGPGARLAPPHQRRRSTYPSRAHHERRGREGKKHNGKPYRVLRPPAGTRRAKQRQASVLLTPPSQTPVRRLKPLAVPPGLSTDRSVRASPVSKRGAHQAPPDWSTRGGPLLKADRPDGLFLRLMHVAGPIRPLRDLQDCNKTASAPAPRRHVLPLCCIFEAPVLRETNSFSSFCFLAVVYKCGHIDNALRFFLGLLLCFFWCLESTRLKSWIRVWACVFWPFAPGQPPQPYHEVARHTSGSCGRGRGTDDGALCTDCGSRRAAGHCEPDYRRRGESQCFYPRAMD